MHTNSRQSAAEPLPVAVIGAGPVGLVAAAYLVTRGERPLILEAGAAVGSSIREWGHVRLFSPWKYLTDPVSRRLLVETGWTLVIGSGHSAFNSVLDLVTLGEESPGTEVAWAVRRQEPGLMFGGGGADALEARGTLGSRLRELVASGAVEFVLGFRAERVVANGRGILIEGDGQRVIGPVDEIVVTTGYRPDLGILRELRVGLDPWLEAPTALAPLIDPNLHSCGAVYPHGYEELEHPERDFFVVGMKSYGRAPTFLLLTGYEQVRSVVVVLTGDLEAARAVELVLPETGVCSTDLVDATTGDGAEDAATIQATPLHGTCCAPASAPLAIIDPTPNRSCCG